MLFQIGLVYAVMTKALAYAPVARPHLLAKPMVRVVDEIRALAPFELRHIRLVLLLGDQPPQLIHRRRLMTGQRSHLRLLAQVPLVALAIQAAFHPNFPLISKKREPGILVELCGNSGRYVRL